MKCYTCLRGASGVRLIGFRTTVGLNRLGEVRVQTWMVGVQLARIKGVGHRRDPLSDSSHSEQRHTNAVLARRALRASASCAIRKLAMNSNRTHVVLLVGR